MKRLTLSILISSLVFTGLSPAMAQSQAPQPAGTAVSLAGAPTESEAIVLGVTPRYETRRLESADCSPVEEAKVVAVDGKRDDPKSGWKAAGIGAVIGVIVGQLIKPGDPTTIVMAGAVGAGAGYGVDAASKKGRRVFAFGQAADKAKDVPTETCQVSPQVAEVRAGYYMELLIGGKRVTVAAAEALEPGTKLRARLDPATNRMTLVL